tara:strand:+ start:82 stop:639 length:558 start_codon:yes stop_codon:yes gene_type:complete
MSSGKVTAKQSREARQYNRENHTHFKQFNKRGTTSTKHTNVANDMRADTDPREYEVFHRQKKDLLVSVINRSATVQEAWYKIKDDPALRIIVQGMNGNESVDPKHYLGNLLQQCVRDGMLVCVYERQLNDNSAYHKSRSINHRWRYIRKSNLPMITYYIIRDYRHSICEKCIKTIKKIGSAFINR